MPIHENMPADAYHALPGASASRLKTFARSPAHCRHELLNPRPPTDAMALGTAVHLAVLEPGLFASTYVAAGPCSAVTGKGEQCRYGGAVRSGGEWFCGTHAKGKPVDAIEVMGTDTLTTCQGIAAAVRAHPAADMLLSNRTHTELSVTWTDGPSGVDCKMRADLLCRVGGRLVVVDLKTTEDASEEGFWRALADYRYDLSHCHYGHGLAAHDLVADLHVLVMAEKKPPYAVGVYEIPAAVVSAQEVPRAEMLTSWAGCEASGVWPAYADGVVTPVTPKWFARKRGVALDA